MIQWYISSFASKWSVWEGLTYAWIFTFVIHRECSIYTWRHQNLFKTQVVLSMSLNLVYPPITQKGYLWLQGWNNIDFSIRTTGTHGEVLKIYSFHLRKHWLLPTVLINNINLSKQPELQPEKDFGITTFSIITPSFEGTRLLEWNLQPQLIASSFYTTDKEVLSASERFATACTITWAAIAIKNPQLVTSNFGLKEAAICDKTSHSRTSFFS